MRSLLVVVAVVGGVAFAGIALGQEVPVTLSPGETVAVTRVGGPCPTFSWAGSAEIEAVELVVYRLGDGGDPEVLWSRSFEVATGSWTPSLDQCLEPGERYAWSARGTESGARSEWSEPRLFEVVDLREPGPTSAPPGRGLRTPRVPASPIGAGSPSLGGRFGAGALAPPEELRVPSAGTSPAQTADAAIRGVASGLGDRTLGVVGSSAGDGVSTEAAGVFGVQSNPLATGEAYGVFGLATSEAGTGVLGVNEANGSIAFLPDLEVPVGVLGIVGESVNNGTAVYGSGGTYGVIGDGLIGGAFRGSSTPLVAWGSDFSPVFLVNSVGDVGLAGDLTVTGGVAADSFTIPMSSFDFVTDSSGAVMSGVNSPACSNDDVMTGGGCECSSGGTVVKSVPEGSTWRCDCTAGFLARAWIVCFTSSP